jgi:acyl-CoA synthetase (AMP-forming)/AMP-acid ligase II
MFKSGGYNVYPREVELALEAHPGVAMAAVLGVDHPAYGEAGVAYVLPAAEVDEDTLRAHCKAELAGYKVPQRIVVDPDPPMLPIGKIDKKALKSAARQLLLEKETAP